MEGLPAKSLKFQSTGDSTSVLSKEMHIQPGCHWAALPGGQRGVGLLRCHSVPQAALASCAPGVVRGFGSRAQAARARANARLERRVIGDDPGGIFWAAPGVAGWGPECARARWRPGGVRVATSVGGQAPACPHGRIGRAAQWQMPPLAAGRLGASGGGLVVA